MWQNSHSPFAELFGYSLGQRFVDKFTKLTEICFSMECFTAVFFRHFLAQMSKFVFCAADWVLTIKFKYFIDFLKIFLLPKILILNSWGNLWGNSYIHLLEKVKKSTNVLSKIIAWLPCILITCYVEISIYYILELCGLVIDAFIRSVSKHLL